MSKTDQERSEVVDEILPWKDPNADKVRFKSGNLFVQAGVLAATGRVRRANKKG